MALLESGGGESLKPGDARLLPIEKHLIATSQLVLKAATAVAREADFTT
jgi:glycerate 2-kinase